MENKGLAGIILMAIAIIVALAFFPAIASNQAKMTDTFSESKTLQAIPTVATALTGQELIGTATVVNSTGVQDCSKNYTIAEGVDTATNTKRIIMTPTATDALCTVLNYSYTYGAEGYIDDTGGRALADTIILFASLALLGVVIYYFWTNGSLDFILGI